MDDHGGNEQVGKRIKHLSKGLVEIQNVPISYDGTVEPRVQFIHQSVGDFLLQHKGHQLIDNTLDTSPIPRSHDSLARACARYLTMIELEWFRENSRLDRVTGVYIRISESELRKTYPFCEYAVRFLFVHASKAEKGGISPLHINQSFGGNQGHVMLCWSYIEGMINLSWRREPETALLYIVAEHGIMSCLVDLLNDGVQMKMNGGTFGKVLAAASSSGNSKMV